MQIKLFITICCLGMMRAYAQNGVLVFQSDFGLKDGAVSAMKGVANGVSINLKLYDITHEIPAYNIWEAAYRLEQTVRYWPAGTVFVSVVDPGVGTERKSVVLKTRSGHFIVTPDNGTLTLVAASLGVQELREIDEAVNRRKNSEASYTFHGRDVYAYTGARLAAKVISFEEVGESLLPTVVTIPYQAAIIENNILKGSIPILDVQYGNVWTNIPATMVQQLNITPGQKLQVKIFHGNKQVYIGILQYAETFGAVSKGECLAYLNSLLRLSFAINQGNFAEQFRIAGGADWRVEVRKAP
ncbi:MAG: S-adenosyl-l-methionine hydroxide adenosyltransferase family protein [Chitinophagaceae bacterium]|nr:S-adenosyl-l-methionine hydroxide adenosyltransferase family protein [Chitinophagaceae bacterium]